MGTAAILAALRNRVRYGLDIIDETGLLAGTVYTTLRRLEKRGLVKSRWEDPAVAEAEGRPRRRYYEITAEGATELERAVTRFGALGGQIGVEGGEA